MKPKIEYDETRRIGRIKFSHHTTTVHGSREFCERFLKSLERDADGAYERAIKAGRDEGNASGIRDTIISEGLLHR